MRDHYCSLTTTTHVIRCEFGTTKPAMARISRLGVLNGMVTSLLTKDGKHGSDCIGATGFHTRTGKFYIMRAKVTIIATSRPARVCCSPLLIQACEFRPPMHRRRACNGLADWRRILHDGEVSGLSFRLPDVHIRLIWRGITTTRGTRPP